MPAAAQTIDGTLAGISRLALQIEPLDADADECGIDRNLLADAVSVEAESGGLTVGGYDFMLYLRISSLPRGGDCFSSVDMEVRYFGTMPLPGQPEGTRVRGVLWSNGTIFITPRRQHGEEAAGIVRSLTRALIEDWLIDNERQKSG